MQFLKDKWQWIVGIVLFVIGVLSSKKTKNKVKELDADAKAKAANKIAEEQAVLTKAYIEEKEKINDKKRNVAVKVEKEIKKEREEIKKDKRLIDDYLKEKGLKKK